ncbi:MAG TPA: cobyric acid synthase [Methylomirabilota bacterium]|nr:cobyric acid synthase [Methylomirabilota bacterium]
MTAQASCLMIQGTASGVGKSVLATAFCRIFARAGYRVAPFKAQNMSLNAAVTVDGGEIGRAQAAQAEACGIEPTVAMNPILLKPEGDDRSQVVVRGVARGSMSFREYGKMKGELLPIVQESLDHLRLSHDLVIIEGAGSPAEINLKDDLVNMGVARMCEAPVLLVGDIDRGGVFASLVGTMELLEPEDRQRVAGFLINKFRGDVALLRPGFDFLTARTGVPVLGVVPYIREQLVPAEDSLSLEDRPRVDEGRVIDIAVARLPRISNFDDFEPLADEPGVCVRFVQTPAELDGADLVILPGTKSTTSDLAFLRESGLSDAIVARASAGDPVIGVCGGYQMLGLLIKDPHGVDSPSTETRGLGLLPVVTTFARKKTTVRVHARVIAAHGPFAEARGQSVSGYEIHVGQTEVGDACRVFALVERGGLAADDLDGAMNENGNVLGSYLHGLFANGGLRQALLAHLAKRKRASVDPRWGQGPTRMERYDRLADLVEASVDFPAIAKLVRMDIR